jgi:hypothetical protein
MDAIWLVLQESAFAAVIRDSVFIYPIANVLHVVAVIAFFGVVATMDLRLIGVFGGVQPRVLIDRLRPWALALFAIIAVAGFILFAAEAAALANNAVFQLKIVALAMALLNVGFNEWMMRGSETIGGAVQASAAASLAAWLSIAALGRSIAYV